MTGAEFSGVDIDLLADYIGGALAGTPEEPAVAALIADDPAWRAAFASLSGGMAVVGAALSRLEPEPMPADLAARLEAMFTTPIDAEPAASPVPHLTVVRDDDSPADTQDPDRVRDRKAAPRPGRRLRWAAPIAVAAGVIAFVGFGLDYLSGRQSQSDSASTASGVGQDERNAGAMAAPSAPRADEIFASGTDYTTATLGSEPMQPMTAAEPGASPPVRKATPGFASGASPGVVSEAEPALQRLTSRAALLDCISAIERENAGGAISVESVDYARFKGAPAVVVRFTARNGRWAWASGPACGTRTAGTDELAKVPVS